MKNPYPLLFFQNHLLQIYYLFEGYLEDLLNYIHDNLTIEFVENGEENYAQNIFERIKENLTSVMQEEIENFQDFKTPSDKTAALEELRIFRRGFSLKENASLNDSIWDSWLKNSDDSELISEFLSELDFSNQNVTGKLKFTATKISTTGQLDVTLNSVNHLVARREDNKINFSVTVALLPIPTKKYKEKFKTKVHKDHDTKEPYLFDLSLNRENLDNFKTKFWLTQSGKDNFGEYKVGDQQFLQFILYDHSRTKTNKIFMGTFFIPIDKIDEKNEKNQASEHKFYNIDESLKMNKEIFGELEKRKCKFADDIDKCIKKGRKVSFFENLKRSPSKTT